MVRNGKEGRKTTVVSASRFLPNAAFEMPIRRKIPIIPNRTFFDYVKYDVLCLLQGKFPSETTVKFGPKIVLQMLFVWRPNFGLQNDKNLKKTYNEYVRSMC